MPVVYVHDNGGRPYKVVVTGRTVEVYRMPPAVAKRLMYAEMDARRAGVFTWAKKPNGYPATTPAEAKEYTELVVRYDDVVRVFIGRDRSVSPPEPNTVLVEISDRCYAFIPTNLSHIMEFTTPEPITRLYSPIGNSDVPYPVALSASFAYFLIEDEYIPRSDLPGVKDWNDAYSVFYHLSAKERRNVRKMRGRLITKGLVPN